MSVTQVDVAIIGGGMVGASLAVALAGTGVVTMLVEGTPPGSTAQPSFDDRTTALGNASRRIFQELGVWEDMAPQAAAIRTIHVSDAGRFGFARLKAEEQDIDAFGYVISNRVIGASLWGALQRSSDVLLRAPARPEHIEITESAVTYSVAGESVSARLVVAADGAHSVVRTTAGIEADVEDYRQIAVVANVVADRPHDGTAYERFTDSGPLAVLPLHDGSYGVIWTCTPERGAQVMSFDEGTYLRELQERFGWRAGKFMRAGARGSYPLKLTRATTTVAPRTVLIGNAAQALHPVAGQGFNLGLRDAAMLAEVIVDAFHNGMRRPAAAEQVGFLADGHPAGATADPGTGPIGAAAQPGTGPIGATAQPGTRPIGAADQPGTRPTGSATQPGTGPIGAADQPGTRPTGSATQPGTGPIGAAEQPGTRPIGAATQPGTGPIGSAAYPTDTASTRPPGFSDPTHAAVGRLPDGADDPRRAIGGDPIDSPTRASGASHDRSTIGAAEADRFSRPDVGSPEMLMRFAEWRAGDRRGVVRFTDGLVKLFGDSRPGVGLLRDLGLLLFDLSPPAKSALARVSAGFSGPAPRLARGLSLQRRSA